MRSIPKRPAFLSRPLVALTLAGGIVSLLLPSISVAADDEVNLYSARKEDLIKPLLDRFTESTGIRVNMVTGKADALLQRLQSEGVNSPADVLLTVDAGNLHRAKQAGITQAIESDAILSAVPATYRDPDGHWTGLSLRARPILYVTAKVDPADLSTYEALTDPQWKGRICIRSSSNVYNQSLVASMIAAEQASAAEDWARGIVANMARPPKGGDRDQIKAAAAGQCDIAIANTYYLAGMLKSQGSRRTRAGGKSGRILAESIGSRGWSRNPCQCQRRRGHQGGQEPRRGDKADRVSAQPGVAGVVCRNER